MNLHEEPALFKETLETLAVSSNIPAFFLEKDYWLTLTLKSLISSPYADLFVFKGGTSLSKAHGMIERFSEDVDLAIIAGELSSNQVRSRMKTTAKTMTQALTELQVEETSKGSRFRRTAHAFPTVLNTRVKGQVSPYLLLEINAFCNPHPFQRVSLQSMIGAYLEEWGRQDLIATYGLASFSLQVLQPERTFAEKVLAIVRASYDTDPIGQLRIKVRHLYDLHLMMTSQTLERFVSADALFEMLEAVQDDDARNHEFQGDWAQKPLASALIFQESDKLWNELESMYMGPFAGMVYGNLPAFNEIRASLNTLKQRLLAFDQHTLADSSEQP